jgi:hypothetical protein
LFCRRKALRDPYSSIAKRDRILGHNAKSSEARGEVWNINAEVLLDYKSHSGDQWSGTKRSCRRPQFFVGSPCDTVNIQQLDAMEFNDGAGMFPGG